MQATRPALLQNLQLLRILVAVQVVYGHALHEAVELFHMPQPMDPFSQMNRIDIFFVISGFATFYASRSQFGGAGEGARFLRRRLTRLIPLYWLFTGLMVLALFLFSGEVAHASFSVEHLLASLFFVPWPNQDGETLPILILGWTLNYEILFSVLFAMALTLPLRAGMILIAGIIALAALAYPFVPEHVLGAEILEQPGHAGVRLRHGAGRPVHARRAAEPASGRAARAGRLRAAAGGHRVARSLHAAALHLGRHSRGDDLRRLRIRAAAERRPLAL